MCTVTPLRLYKKKKGMCGERAFYRQSPDQNRLIHCVLDFDSDPRAPVVTLDCIAHHFALVKT